MALTSIVEVEEEEEEAVVVVVVEVVLLSQRDLNLNDDYFVLIDNSIHPPFEAKRKIPPEPCFFSKGSALVLLVLLMESIAKLTAIQY